MSLKEIKNVRLVSKSLRDSIHNQLNEKSVLVLKNFNENFGLLIFSKLQIKCLEIQTKSFADMVALNKITKIQRQLNLVEEVTVALLLNHVNVLKTILNEMSGLKVLKIPNDKNQINFIEASKMRFRSLNFTNLENLEVF